MLEVEEEETQPLIGRDVTYIIIIGTQKKRIVKEVDRYMT